MKTYLSDAKVTGREIPKLRWLPLLPNKSLDNNHVGESSVMMSWHSQTGTRHPTHAKLIDLGNYDVTDAIYKCKFLVKAP
jgi:hypothetical protein